MSGLLTRRALVLAKIESTAGVDAVPDPAVDAIQVIEPNFSMDATILERRVATPDMSLLAHAVGRKIARLSFQTEVNGSGRITSNIVDLPRMHVLLRMCGMQTVIRNNSGSQFPVWSGPTNVGAQPSWTRGGSAVIAPPAPAMFIVVCVVGGPSGTAQLAVLNTNNDAYGPNLPAVVVTSGVTALPAGNTALTLQPTWTGNLAAGDVWVVPSLTRGTSLMPRSSGFETGTLYAYFDGLLHRLTGSVGSFSLTGEAGDFPRFNFEFTGEYNPVTDTAIPTPTWEDVSATQVELGNLVLDRDRNLMVAGVTFDMQNTVAPRASVNDTDGINSFRISARNPVGTINPESTLEQFEALLNIVGNTIRNPFGDGLLGGAGGQAPTNWLIQVAGGLTRTITGYGFENGLPFLDIAVSGTTTDTGFLLAVNFEGLTQIAAAQNSFWSTGVGASLRSGSVPSLVQIGLTERKSDASFVNRLANITLTGTTQRFATTQQAQDALVTHAIPTFAVVNPGIGTNVTFTVRLSMPLFVAGNTLPALPSVPAEAAYPFWADMATGRRIPFMCSFGTARTNRLVMFAPRAQISGVAYGDREGVRTYDVNLAFKSGSAQGNDEVLLHFG